MKTKIKNKGKKYHSYIVNLMIPAFVFGSLTGILTAVVVTFYKLCAKYAIGWAEQGYHFLRERPYFIPVALVIIFGFSFVMALVCKKVPTVRGGGIPTTIGILRGVISFKWLRNLLGLFALSLGSFIVGAPLGNEGPSVQMGAAIGKGCVRTLAKKHRAWERYTMTGGACAGFSVATGAPISGIMFALEEAHQRISPMIIIVSATSVMFAGLTSRILSPVLGVSPYLFPELALVKLGLRDVWIPVAVGAIMGLFAVLFLRYYGAISALFSKVLGRWRSVWKIFLSLGLTLAAGLVSFSFISTGHELILSFFEENRAIYALLIILVIRSTLTLFANTSRITGGIFLPVLAIGATLASLLGEIAQRLFGISEEYYVVIVALGIAACISGMMKMPLTAIAFAVEALSCHENVVFVIIVSIVSFVITEVFEVKSVNDTVLERTMKERIKGKSFKVIDTFVTVKRGSFAVGKQIRDIFWPANLFVLSVKKNETVRAEVDEHGGKELREGDLLHVRYSTFDEAQIREELIAIVGEQEYTESETDIV